MRIVRIANPFVRGILRSRLHRVLSGSLLLLSYRGHLSGRMFEIPLRYAETQGRGLVVVAVRPERKLWWRSFVGATPASVVLRGRRVPVVGALAEASARDEPLARYVDRHPRSARFVRHAAIVVLHPTR